MVHLIRSISIFKKINIIYWSLFTLGAVIFMYYILKIIIYWYGHYESFPFIFYSIVFIFYILLINTIFSKIVKIKYHHINKFFYEDCDPLRYIETIEKERNPNGSRNVNTSIQLMICLAYIQINRADKAKEILDNVSDFPDNEGGLFNKRAYYSTLFAYNIYISDLEKAEAVIYEMMDFIKSCNLYKHYLIDYDSEYRAKFNLLELAKGHYDGLEQYFAEKFKPNDIMLNKVNIKFILGDIYLHNHKANEAKDAFEYVVRHGNKLHTVQKAKQYLEQLS